MQSFKLVLTSRAKYFFRFDPYAEVDANATLSNDTDIEENDEEEAIDVFEVGVQVWTTVQLDCQLEEGAESIFWVTPTNTVFLIKNKTTDGEFCKPTSAILEHACGQVHQRMECYATHLEGSFAFCS